MDANEDKTSLEEGFRRIRLSDVERPVRHAIEGGLGLLFLGSILLTFFGISGARDWPLIARIPVLVLLACTSVPAILQFVDWRRKPDSPSPLTIDRMTAGVARRILRRKQTKFITVYGRQEMAKRLSPEMADMLSVAHQMKIHRRRRRWMVGTGLVVVAAVTGGILFVIFRPSRPLQVSVGHDFRIDSTFTMTVPDAPKCSKAECTVELRFRNISGYQTSIGDGSFTDPQFAATSGLCDPSPLAQCSGPFYVISLIDNGNHYDFLQGTFSPTLCCRDRRLRQLSHFKYQVGRRVKSWNLIAYSRRQS
jgi:hypothetical protein